jgi:D-alanine-D-alanine ligase
VPGRPRRTDIPVLLLYNDDPAWGAAEAAEAARAVAGLQDALRDEGHPVTPAAVRDEDLEGVLRGVRPEDHLVVNWCEELPGVPRSEAQVAGTLEGMGFVYTGSPPEVLDRCWDRRRVKARLERFGIPTPRWQCPPADEEGVEPWERFPAIVKPALEHCSVGITPEAVVLNRRELADRVAFVRETFGQPALVEEFIDGRELHVTVWGNGAIDVLPLAEMDFSYFPDLRDRLCTFDSKFTPGSAHYEKIEVRVPAPLTDAERLGVEQVVRRTYRAFACRDYARVDLRLLGGRCLVLDVNPNADISPDTSPAYAAEVAGFSYGAFASGVVNLAAHRHPGFRGELGGVPGLARPG